MPRIDLHTHSNHSDGTAAPADLLCLASEAGLAAVALADHDTTSGLEEAHEAGAAVGVEVIDACEISTRIPEGSVHILAYGFDPSDEALHAFLTRVREKREARNLAMIERLAELGLELDYEHEVACHAEGRIVARPHFARAMVERGYIDHLQQAYTSYIGDDGPGYVLGDMPHPVEAIQVAKAAGAAISLAHPRQIRVEGDEAYARLLKELCDAGLDAIEVHHPSHKPRHRKFFASLADRFGLIQSGGSDFHGANKPYIVLGEGDGTIDVHYETWEHLRGRCRARSP